MSCCIKLLIKLWAARSRVELAGREETQRVAASGAILAQFPARLLKLFSIPSVLGWVWSHFDAATGSVLAHWLRRFWLADWRVWESEMVLT